MPEQKKVQKDTWNELHQTKLNGGGLVFSVYPPQLPSLPPIAFNELLNDAWSESE
jgi:hypothetical protein